jgi:hypothetical protein
MSQTVVCDNDVRRDSRGDPGESRWHALFIEDALKRPDRNKFPAAVRSPFGATIRLDELRTMVLSERRIRFTPDLADTAAPVATNVRAPAPSIGSVAIVTGNSFFARGGVPAVVAHTTSEITFSNNRCELFDSALIAAVQLDAPLLLVHGNRVRNSGEISILLPGAPSIVSAGGNITSFGISSLPEQWKPLNTIG